MEYKLPPLPFAVFDEFGKSCEDRVCDHFIAAIEAQDVSDGVVLQIDAAVTQAQKVISDWNEWYGMHGENAPIPPGGIVKAQEMLSVAKSLLASSTPAQQAKPQPLSDEKIVDAYCKERGMRQYVEAYVAGARFAEAAHGITKE